MPNLITRFTAIIFIAVFLSNSSFGALFADGLLAMAKKGDLAGAKQLIDSAMNSPDEDEDLDALGEEGQPAIVLLIREALTYPDRQKGLGGRLITYLKGKVGFKPEVDPNVDQVITYLMSEPIDPNVVNREGETALIEALRATGADNDHKYVEALLNKGADPNMFGRFATPLFEAVKNADKVGVELLLRQNRIWAHLGSRGGTPPSKEAWDMNQVEIAELIDQKVEVQKPKLQKEQKEIAALRKATRFLELRRTRANNIGNPLVSVGNYHTCAIKTDGKLGCWGEYYYNKATERRTEIRDVSGGHGHTCAIKLDNTLECWGDPDIEMRIPQDFKTDVSKVSARQYHTCAVKTDGILGCWGYDKQGEGSVPASLRTDIIDVSSGEEHNCAIKKDYTLSCWGKRRQGATESGGIRREKATVPLRARTEIAQVSAGYGHDCAIKKNGTLICWGENDYGQTKIPKGFKTDIYQVSVGNDYTCAVKMDGTLGCWGSNSDGKIKIPTDFKSGIQQISTGKNSTCAINTDGILRCWGGGSMNPDHEVPLDFRSLQ